MSFIATNADMAIGCRALIIRRHEQNKKPSKEEESDEFEEV